MNGYLYILRDSKNHFYIGSTDNINRRMHQHMNGHTQTTTRMVEPKLVLVQKYAILAQARKIELRIKRLKRKGYIENDIG